MVRRLLAGEIPAFPDFWFPIVDVRDVAIAHVQAMTALDAAGQRFIVGSGSGLTMKEIGFLLRERLGEQAARVPTRSIPSAAPGDHQGDQHRRRRGGCWGWSRDRPRRRCSPPRRA